MQETTKPLAGVRILDAATFLAAPYAASLLSEYGADVIKVEQPSGDTMRGIPPLRGDVSVWWKVIARNRQSVALDLNTEEGRAVFKQLAAQCDVVIMNFRPAALKKWGLEFEDLVSCREDIVFYHLTAFGAGPYEQRPGFARVAEAYAGLTNRTGFPGGPPVQSGYAMLGDGIAGIYGAFALMLALRQRDRTGQPQKVDLGLYEPLLSLMEDMIVTYDETGSRMERMGNASPRWAPHGLFPTKDGLYAILACSTEKLWRQLRAAMQDESLAVYDNDAAGRVANRAELEARISEWTRCHDLSDLLEVCGKAGLAVGPIYSAAEIVKDPHIIARGSIITLDDPETGKPIRMASPAGRFSGFKGEVRSVGPKVGEHTDSVLSRLLGLAPAQINALRDKGVIK
ncbi:CaiB/BaiF CoA transferase family protein [Cupriavidus alkaliphilus]|uniref:CaiB/BaiF CoA transferase family protein n=1 Tax=Cupriavidus alkaliphilus TaxID=942866 RepID=UPI00160BE0B4|nr:CoA transferase [Cupriavidus alkaliphilus]MBB3014158.1 crotonobetainyl-CoA:carnitine CoA-transferase CaiB-like acyl-CoA transferase [Cupriavidus alkaliphilus]